MNTQLVTADAPVLPRRKAQRLRPCDVAMLLQLHQDKLTQVEIAQRLGCDQKTVSNWLTRLTDTTSLANSYIRANAFPMAEKIVKSKRVDVQLKALQGVGVAAESEQGPRVVIQIGGQSADVKIAIGATFAPLPSAVSVDSHSLTGATGSDK